MFSYMFAAHIKRGGRVLILTHRIELLKQAGGAFNRFSLSAETIEAGKVPDLTQSLHVAMIKTLDRKSTRLNSSHVAISYAVFCLKKKNNTHDREQHDPTPLT